jgi:hypothetical protein
MMRMGPDGENAYQMCVEVQPLYHNGTQAGGRNKVYLPYPKGTYALPMTNCNLWSRVNVARLQFPQPLYLFYTAL